MDATTGVYRDRLRQLHSFTETAKLLQCGRLVGKLLWVVGSAVEVEVERALARYVVCLTGCVGAESTDRIVSVIFVLVERYVGVHQMVDGVIELLLTPSRLRMYC